jgi:biliverdin reductase
MVRVGIVGTGFVAQKRAEALKQDGRGQLVAIAGHKPTDTHAFATTHGVRAMPSWQALVADPQIDLVMVCHINRDHGPVTAAALAAQKHVVVEYPLSLQLAEAESLLTLAQRQGRLLHVEHIDLLGGLHRALKQHLATIGQPFYVRYSTLSPKRPAPQGWTYCPELFGFPLVGALSRLNRLIDAFGPVKQVYGQNHYEDLTLAPDGLPYYRTCLCTAQLTFANGLMASVIYGKGEGIWQLTRQFEVAGTTGHLMLEDNRGQITTEQGTRSLSLGSRRGAFNIDTAAVLDHVLEGKPLYCTPAASVYALQVATAIQQSAATGQVVQVEPR